MKKLNVALVLFLSIFLMQSCQKDDLTTPVDPQAQKAPNLPKEESFIMPFSAFEEFSEEDDSRTTSNWLYSASNVVIWNLVLTQQLIIPVASFYESFNHSAVYQGNGVWLWAYEIPDNNGNYHAELYGELLASNEVKWDMYISQDGVFPLVHWYSGTTANDGSYANWNLSYNPSDPTPIINISYQKNDGNGVESIRYTNIIPGAPENGGYIEYKKANNQVNDYNRMYDIFNSETDNLLEIRWNNPGNDGRVKDPAHYQDEEWHCWNSALQDIDC